MTVTDNDDDGGSGEEKMLNLLKSRKKRILPLLRVFRVPKYQGTGDEVLGCENLAVTSAGRCDS